MKKAFYSKFDSDFESSGSIQATTENLDEISEKIKKMVPDMDAIRATGIIKQTDSFKESKHILDNFKETMKNSPGGTFDNYEEPPKEVEKDSRSPLEQATDTLHTVVEFMLRAGIKVPSIYKDFLYSVRPPKPQPREVDIEKSKPLFAIAGLDEDGNVRLETDTDIKIKRGKQSIKLKEEKLRKTLEDSKKVDTKNVQEMRDWIACKVKEAGSLDKVSDETWAELRKDMKDRLSKTEDEENDDNTCVVSSDDIDEIIDELENEERPNPKVKAPPFQKLTEGTDPDSIVKEAEAAAKISYFEKEKNVIQTVNRNAYELRQLILQDAIKVVRNNYEVGNLNGFVDKVMEVADKFYSFVENRKKQNR